jgi:ATP-dependent Clp protease adaptor protein ClpS
MSRKTEAEEDISVLEREDIQPPNDYSVIMFNDDKTSMGFVISILTEVFNKDKHEAYRIMMDIHNEGKGIAGVYNQDIAITKSEITHRTAEKYGFPLRTEVEPAL